LTEAKVGFDCRYIKPNSNDGISRFSLELFKRLNQTQNVVAIVSNSQQLDVLGGDVRHVFLNDPTSITEPLAALRLNRYDFQTVFSPMQTIGSFGKKFKLILTVHDLIYYYHPKPPSYLNPFIRLLWRLYHLSFVPQRMLLSRADHIVTVSETSKGLIEKHRLAKSPITVVPNASEGLIRSNLETTQTIVYMGSFMPYKNVQTLIRAAGLLKNYKLVLLSKIEPQTESELSSLAKRIGANVEFLNGVTDQLYAEILSSSTALVHASSDEGFGIPIIEAMSVGCPVICSDIEIFREVAGEAGLFFDNTDPDELAQKVIFANQNRRDLEPVLLAQAKKFNWEASADELAKLLF